MIDKWRQDDGGLLGNTWRVKTIVEEGEPLGSTPHQIVHGEAQLRPEKVGRESYSGIDLSLRGSATSTKSKRCDRWGHPCKGCQASITASESNR